MPAVSVIIPVYNNEAFVETCIRSVLAQTYHDLELIVVNDGSSDGSLEILRRLAAEDARICLLNQENRGVSAARNRGLDTASGKYVTFVDGDDCIRPDYIERLYECAEKQEAELIICGLRFVKEDGTVLRTIIPGEYRRFEKEEWTFRISAVWSHFYRRDVWERYHVRFVPGERGEDMVISLFFSAVCEKIDTLQEAGYDYVQHPSSAMHQFRGLETYRLPYQGLERTLQNVEQVGLRNSRAFYELFVLRILCTCYFDLARGASKEKRKELCTYIVRILQEYFPKYYENRLTRLFSQLEVPFVQKAAVRCLIWLVRTNLLYPVSGLLRG